MSIYKELDPTTGPQRRHVNRQNTGLIARAVRLGDDRKATHAAPVRPDRVERTALLMGLAAIVVVICVLKAMTLSNFLQAPVWATYSLLVLVFIFGRFGLAWRYRPRTAVVPDAGLPSVAIIVPRVQRGERHYGHPPGRLAVDYPSDRIKVVVVDDRSTDHTLQRIRDVEYQFRSFDGLPPTSIAGNATS